MGVVVDYFENAYFTSFHYLVNKKLHWTERIFWAICISTCMGGGLYVIFTLVHEYAFQKVLFYVDVNYLKFKTPFPSIILCESAATSAKIIKSLSRHSNFKIARQEELDAFNQLIYYENFQGSNLLPLSTCQEQYMKNSDTSSEECQLDQMLRPLSNYSTFAEEVISTCDEIFTVCHYNGKEFPCCEYFLPLYSARGLCYASNNLNTYKNGTIKTELDFFIDMTTGDSIGNMSIEIQHDFLTIHYLPPSGIPSNRIDAGQLYDTSKGFSPHEDIFFKLKEIVSDGQNIRHLKIDLRGCMYFDESQNLDIYEIYSPYACDIESLMHTQYKHCNCVSHVMPTNKDTECDFSGLMCLLKQNEIIKKDYASEIFETHVCIPSCDNLEIDVAGILSQNKSYHFNDPRSKRMFNFIAPTPHRKFIRKCKVDQLSLIVAAGGALGLFVGCSFLSFAQIIYYMLCRPTTDCARGLQNRKQIVKKRQMDKKFAKERNRLQIRLLEEKIRNHIKIKLREFEKYNGK